MARKNVMLCYPFEEKRFNKWNTSVLVQPKYDGIRCRALLHHDRVELLSSTEHPLDFAVPHISNILYEFRQVFIDRGIFELDGELYNHDLTFEAIDSICSRTVELNPQHEYIQFHIFDHVCEQRPFYERIKEVTLAVEWIGDQWLRSVPTATVDDMKWMNLALTLFTNDNYEGIIVRHPDYPYERKRSTGIMKWKPRKSDQYEVVDYAEEIDKHGSPKGSLGALFVRDESDNIFKVGTGFTQKQRLNYWARADDLIGKQCVIKYQHVTERGVPRFPVFDVLVEE